MKKIFSILSALMLVASLGLAMSLGLVTAATQVPTPTTWYVAEGGAGAQDGSNWNNAFPTIQQAIDVAGPGDTVKVAEGEYDAFLVEARANISVIGAEGATVTTTDLYTALPIIGKAWVLAAVYDSEGVNIEGIDFDGTGVGGKPVVVGIAYVDSTGRIVDLTVENVIATEKGAGVAIIGHAGISGVEMTGATISDNGGVGQTGVYVCGGSTLEAHLNNIIGNSECGLLDDGGGMVDATRNWWGDESGPRHVTNIFGTGNAVLGDVDFKPWLGGETVVEPVTDGIVDAKVEADAEVVVDGTATVGVARYADNPHEPPPTGFTLLGKYLNVYVPDTTQVNAVEIRLYYTDAEVESFNETSLRLFWWDGDDWVACSDSGVNTVSSDGYGGYIWAKITATTTLSVGDSQLNIDIDGGGESPSNPPRPCCAATLAAASGTNGAEKLNILRQFRNDVMLPDALSANLVSLYYRTSPPIASLISQHDVITRLVRLGFLDPIVRILNRTQNLWSPRGQ